MSLEELVTGLLLAIAAIVYGSLAAYTLFT